MPTKPMPLRIPFRSDCLPSGDIGGFLSVPGMVRSPVVKKSTALKLRKSFESKIRPSLLEVTPKPCFAPSEVTAWSTMQGLPADVFTTSCSNPDDLVKTRTDFLSEAKNSVGRERPIVATVAVFMNRRRLNEYRLWCSCIFCLHTSETPRAINANREWASRRSGSERTAMQHG